MADEQMQDAESTADASQLTGSDRPTSGGETRPGTGGTAEQDFGIKPPNPSGDPVGQVPGVEP